MVRDGQGRQYFVGSDVFSPGLDTYICLKTNRLAVEACVSRRARQAGPRIWKDRAQRGNAKRAIGVGGIEDVVFESRRSRRLSRRRSMRNCSRWAAYKQRGWRQT